MNRSPLGRAFLTVWAGQALSAIGSSVSGIGIAVYVFVETGDAATLGWFVAIASAPFALTAPFIPLADRFSRRSVMIAGDTFAVVGPAVALVLATIGELEVWHLAVAAFLGGIGASFQFPAAAAAVPALVPPDALDRANGLDQAGPAAGIVLGPVIATPVVARWGIEAVLLIDVATFLVAVGATLAVPFDDVPRTDVDDDGSWAATRHWLFDAGRPLLAVLASMAVTNFTLSFFNVSILVVATEAGGVALAGVALGAGGLAMLIGSIDGGRRGVARDRIGVIASGLTVVGVGFVAAASRPIFVVIVAGIALALAPVPRVSAAASTIFHERVPPSMYGRVFGLRSMVGRALDPIGAVVAGILVADLAEPAMLDGGVLADTLGVAMGTGAGRGAAVVLAGAGFALVAVAVVLRRSSARGRLHADRADAPRVEAPTVVANSRR